MLINLSGAGFTTISEKFDSSSRECIAPIFRKRFNASACQKAEIAVCGLGYAYYYINGKCITKDLFTAPVSNYNKTLWYNTYDVTEFLRDGENVISVFCGNGWFNENFNTSWSFNKADWRNNPMFAVRLVCDDNVIVESGTDGWVWKESAVIYNQLRSGEHFDARLWDENVFGCDYDDSQWKDAVSVKKPDGVLRECLCEPIREFDIYDTVAVTKTGEMRYLYDMGQNMSGYIRLSYSGDSGDELIIRYGEDITNENELNYNGALVHYPETEYETDRFICSGKEIVWSPRFTYHGFRYIDISGVKYPDKIKVQAVFVHQDIEKRSDFECSDEFLNRLYYMGEMSTYSNLFYMPTDCPSREKLGWINDVQFSADQFMINYKMEKLLEKWLQDIFDSMQEDGSIPGIVPTWGWGFGMSGAVCDGALYEIPYRTYLHTGNDTSLRKSLPYFKKNLAYLEGLQDEDGLCDKGLGDHAAPNFSKTTPKKLVNGVLMAKMYDVAMIAANLCGDKDNDFAEKKEKLKQAILKKYYREDRQCAAEDQTSVAMLIVSGFCDDISQLSMQLQRLVGENMYHHNCGQVGLWYLYRALDMIGLSDYVYKIITAKGFPSYSMWTDSYATTLHELWKGNSEREKELLIGSRNHHMYSDVCGWFIHSLLGIKPETPGYKTVTIEPKFIKGLDFVRGFCDTVKGKIEVSWIRDDGKIKVTIAVPEGISAHFRGDLIEGTNTFYV